MDMKSIGATVYSYWQYFFYTGLFKDQTDLNKDGKHLMEEHNEDETKK